MIEIKDPVIVDLNANLKGFNQGIDRAKTDFTKILSKGLKVAAGVGVAALTALAGASTAAFVAFREQEKSEQKLLAVIQATGRDTEKAGKELFKTAKSLQSVTTFSDEAILSAEALIASFRGISTEQIPQVTELIADISTIMGNDLKSNAIAIGKALNDPATQLSALSRQGIRFSDGQEKFIKELVEKNRTDEAQKLILQELQEEFGGAARASAQGLGSFVILKNTVNDLVQEFGRTIAPEILATINLLGKGLVYIKRASEEIFSIKATLISLLSAIGAATQTIIDGFNDQIIAAGLRVKALFKNPFSDAGKVILKEANEIAKNGLLNALNASGVFQEEFDKTFVEVIGRDNEYQRIENLTHLVTSKSVLDAFSQADIDAIKALGDDKKEKPRELTKLEKLEKDLQEEIKAARQIDHELIEKIALQDAITFQKVKNKTRKDRIERENFYGEEKTGFAKFAADLRFDANKLWSQTTGEVEYNSIVGIVDLVATLYNTVQGLINTGGKEKTLADKIKEVAAIHFAATIARLQAIASLISSGPFGIAELVITEIEISIHEAIAVSDVNEKSYSGGPQLNLQGLAGGMSGGESLGRIGQNLEIPGGFITKAKKLRENRNKRNPAHRMPMHLMVTLPRGLEVRKI